MSDRYIVIDEEGYFSFDGRRVDDQKLGSTLLENIKIDEHGRLLTSYEGTPTFIESFDAPFMARHVSLSGDGGEIELAYGLKQKFSFSSLSVDEWDRFHGRTVSGVPFVFTRQGQIEFFDLLDSFEDDSVTVKGKIYDVPQWTAPVLKPIGEESPVIREILPQLKLTRSRILMLDSGEAHNAAAIARAGHFVTAVESDTKLMAVAQAKYGQQENLRLVRADHSNIPDNWNGEFDLIFTEDVLPSAATVKLWRRLLSETGTVLGIFPALEWELRERLKAGFQALFWTRWRRSIEPRKSRELIVYARKK